MRNNFAQVLSNVHTIPDIFCAGTKTIRDLGLLFSHKNSDCGAISVTERSCTAPISKEESHISGRCSFSCRHEKLSGSGPGNSKD